MIADREQDAILKSFTRFLSENIGLYVTDITGKMIDVQREYSIYIREKYVPLIDKLIEEQKPKIEDSVAVIFPVAKEVDKTDWHRDERKEEMTRGIYDLSEMD